jgi:hypothetical protein
MDPLVSAGNKVNEFNDSCINSPKQMRLLPLVAENMGTRKLAKKFVSELEKTEKIAILLWLIAYTIVHSAGCRTKCTAFVRPNSNSYALLGQRHCNRLIAPSEGIKKHLC